MKSRMKRIFEKVYSQSRRRRKKKQIVIEFYPYTGLKHTLRESDERIKIRLSDAFTDAPDDVLESLAYILFSNVYRKNVPEKHRRNYYDYIHSERMRDRHTQMRKERGRKVLSGTEGRHRNLEASFDRVNRGYFDGEMDKPVLTWSKRETRRMFGHWDEAHSTVVISRTLDSPGVPLYVLDSVMYHELLHIKHGIKYGNGRRDVHSAAFRQDDKKFKRYREAKEFLRNLGKKERKRKR